MVAGDFNGDGHQDLALSSASILVLLGNGRGGFGPPISTATTEPIQSLASGDFNNDGKLDLAVVTFGSPKSLVAFLGNGDGTFSLAQMVARARDLDDPLVYDIDGDGNEDIIVQGTIYPGNGNGAFQAPVSYPTAGTPKWIAIADVNGDGHADILGSIPSGNMSIALGNGGLSFELGADYCAGSSGGWIGAADFLGHGRADIVVITGSYIRLLPGLPDGQYPAQPVIRLQQSAINNPVLADFNGDGNLDAAVLTYSSSISILLGDGKAGFSPGTPALAGPLPAGLISGDFNGDGYPDLVFSTNASVDLFLGNGNLDLAFTNSQSQLVIDLGNGDGTFKQGQVINQFPGAPLLADFNGDGYLDLFGNSGPEPYFGLYLGNGNGTFNQEFSAPLFCVTQVACGAAAGDVNGDGKTDLVSLQIGRQFTHTPLTVLLNTTP